MSVELNDVVKAFAVLEEQTKSIEAAGAAEPLRDAINSLLMALGGIELRLNQLEARRTAQTAATSNDAPSSRKNRSRCGAA